eukprot:1873818-Rhodomonas_salina.1
MNNSVVTIHSSIFTTPDTPIPYLSTPLLSTALRSPYTISVPLSYTVPHPSTALVHRTPSQYRISHALSQYRTPHIGPVCGVSQYRTPHSDRVG